MPDRFRWLDGGLLPGRLLFSKWSFILHKLLPWQVPGKLWAIFLLHVPWGLRNSMAQPNKLRCMPTRIFQCTQCPNMHGMPTREVPGQTVEHKLLRVFVWEVQRRNLCRCSVLGLPRGVLPTCFRAAGLSRVPRRVLLW